MSLEIEDIDLEQPIETNVGRATQQVDVTERLLATLTAGFEPDAALVLAAQKLGVDLDAVRSYVEQLYGEPDEDYE